MKIKFLLQDVLASQFFVSPLIVMPVISIFSFVRRHFYGIVEELQKIRFPSREDVLSASLISILMVCVIGVLIYVADSLSFFALNRLIVGI